MPLVDLDFVRSVVPADLARTRIGIETGTCFGASTRILAQALSRVWTIELNDELSERTERKMRAQGFDNVEFLRGDSGTELEKLLDAKPWGEESLLVFLDAHWSGDHSVDWSARSVAGFKGYGADTAHLGEGARPTSEEQNPLLRELRAIVERARGPALILIDDTQILPESGPGARDYGFAGEDWSHLSREAILATLGPRLAGKWINRRSAREEQWLLRLN